MLIVAKKRLPNNYRLVYVLLSHLRIGEIMFIRLLSTVLLNPLLFRKTSVLVELCDNGCIVLKH